MNVDLDDASGSDEPGIQALLPLDAPPLPPGVPLLPARMVNEYVYCPRLAYLEWVQGEWAESGDGDTPQERIHVRSLEFDAVLRGFVPWPH